MNETKKFMFRYICNKNTNCKQSTFVLIKSSIRNLNLVFLIELFWILFLTDTHEAIFHRQQLRSLLVFDVCMYCMYVCIVHIYPPFTRKRIVSLYFGRDVRTHLVVAISEMSGPPVFHIKAEASR